MTRSATQEIRSGWWSVGGKPLTAEQALPVKP